MRISPEELSMEMADSMDKLLPVQGGCGTGGGTGPAGGRDGGVGGCGGAGSGLNSRHGSSTDDDDDDPQEIDKTHMDTFGGPPPPIFYDLQGNINSMTDIVRLNVGGTMFVTQRCTLEGCHNTRLSNLQSTDPNYNSVMQEWFFDRNPQLFNFILDFYRSGELHFPHTFCGPSIKKELFFWQIDECEISPCCWNRYREYEQEKKIFEHIEQAFESKTLQQYTNSNDFVNPTRSQIWRKRVYIFMEEPMSSKAATVWTFMFLSFVLISIGILCIETHPKLRVPREGLGTMVFRDNVTMTTTEASTTDSATKKPENLKVYWLLNTKPHPALEHIDSFCTSFFTVEFFIRLLSSPNRANFCKSPMNIIDILCVLPMWIKYLMQMYNVQMNRDILPVFFIIMILRVLRICRVLRLARHYTGVKILLLALKASLRELLMLLIFVFIVVLCFAVVIYYAEFFEPDTFHTIPEGYWWAIITLTTVGYGDMYPRSAMGYCVGALCALTGILATGLPVPIIANNFNLYYAHAQMKHALSSRKLESHTRSTSSLDKHSEAITYENENARPDGVNIKEATV